MLGQNTRFLALGLVPGTPHHGIDPQPAGCADPQLAEAGDEDPGLARRAEGSRVPRREVDTVKSSRSPHPSGSATLGARRSPSVVRVRSPESSIRATASLGRGRPDDRPQLHTEGPQHPVRPLPEDVIAQCGEEGAGSGEAGDLDRGRGPPAGRPLPVHRCVNDLAGGRHPLDARQAGPFHVPDHRDPHRQRLPPDAFRPCRFDLFLAFD
jgi:hypothetical protein